MRSRLNWWSQANVRSTTHRVLPSPEPVRGSSTVELGDDPTGEDKTPVLVVVVPTVGEQPTGPVAWPAAQATDAGYVTRQRHELGDVVTVSAGQGNGEPGSVPVDDQVVLAAGAGSVDWRRSGVSPL